MAHLPDRWEREQQENIWKEKIALMTAQAIAEYGEDLGHAFAKYVLFGNSRDLKESLQVKNEFYGRIVIILSNGNPAQKILAFRAMIEASEQYTENRIREVISGIRQIY